MSGSYHQIVRGTLGSANRFIIACAKVMLGEAYRNSLTSFAKNSQLYARHLNSRLTVIAGEFARQTNGIVSLRLRRGFRLAEFASNLGYDFRQLKAFRVPVNGKRGKLLTRFSLFAAAVFSWDENRISEEEIKEVADEMLMVPKNGDKGHKIDKLREHLHNWEVVINRENLYVWRKPVENAQLYEYKVFGTYDDVPSRAFFNAQTNIDFRKSWDKLVKVLEVIEREGQESEVIRWVTRFPYPMWNREYVYMRRFHVDQDRKLMVIMSRSIDHPQCPPDPKSSVRIDSYLSVLVIRPRTSSFDDDGFDYILSYYDDPQAIFPSYCYNWLAATGVPDFVEQMYMSAKRLHDIEEGYIAAEEESESNKLPM